MKYLIIAISTLLLSCKKQSVAPDSNNIVGTTWVIYQYTVPGIQGTLTLNDTLDFYDSHKYRYNGKDNDYYLAMIQNQYNVELKGTFFADINGTFPYNYKDVWQVSAAKFKNIQNNHEVTLWLKRIK